MPSVSKSFLVTICGIAMVAAGLSVAFPDSVFGVTALLLGLYGVHGLGLRFLSRERGEEVQELRSELEHERAAHEAERAQHSAMEKEWIGVPGARGAPAQDLKVL